MTHLRKMMLEELQRRNYAETTIDCYLRAVEEFSRHFHCSPDRLGPQHIREYQAELFQKRKFSPNTVAQHLAALRFFYVKTLKKAWSIAETPYPKKAVHLPTILSQEEVAQLIDAARPPLHRTLLMALYATGLRRAELARLKVSDVDSQRMVIHVAENAIPKRLGSLFETPLRWPTTCTPVSGALYPSRGRLQPPLGFLCGQQSHFPLARLRSPQRTKVAHPITG